MSGWHHLYRLSWSALDADAITQAGDAIAGELGGQVHGVLDLGGVPEAGVRGDHLVAHVVAGEAARRVVGLEQPALCRVHVAVGGASLAAQRQDQGVGQARMSGQIEARLRRGVDESVVRAQHHGGACAAGDTR